MNDSHKSGVIAELKAQIYYVEEGYEVYSPLMSQSKCDFIACKGSEVIKVQVKKATENPTKFGTYLQIRIQGKSTEYGCRTYTKEDFDELIISYKDNLWKLPVDLVLDKKSLTFGKLLDGEIITGSKSSVKTEEHKVR